MWIIHTHTVCIFLDVIKLYCIGAIVDVSQFFFKIAQSCTELINYHCNLWTCYAFCIFSNFIFLNLFIRKFLIWNRSFKSNILQTLSPNVVQGHLIKLFQVKLRQFYLFSNAHHYTANKTCLVFGLQVIGVTFWSFLTWLLISYFSWILT